MQTFKEDDEKVYIRIGNGHPSSGHCELALINSHFETIKLLNLCFCLMIGDKNLT